MPSKIFGVLLLAALTLTAGAQNKTYTVQKGDTVEGIAKRFHIRQAELVAVNALGNSHKVRTGQILRIPASSPVVQHRIAQTATKGKTYTVRNGDSDWTIARKHDMTVKELKALNPGVDFVHLKLGITLRVPGTVAVAKAPEKTTKVASKSPAKPAKKVSTVAYKIKDGDNDWLLARRYDLHISDLRALNPGVDLSRVHPGQIIKVPGAPKTDARVAKTDSKHATQKVAANQPKIRSKHAVVAADSCIIRRNPSVSAEKVTVVPKGTQVAVLDFTNGWYKLRFPKGTVGWMRGDLLKPLKTSEAADAMQRVAKNTTKHSTAEKSSSTKRVASHTESSHKSSMPRANRPGSPVRVASNYSGNSDVIDTALSKLGTRYRWGATGRGAFDCSGLVQWAYKQNGVRLPRTSAEMASAGSAVRRSDLKKGDLILFRTRRGAYVSHVGIYMGDGKFVHASSGKGRVTTSSLDEAYYSRAYVTARRVSNTASSSKKTASKSKAKISAPTVAEEKPALDRPAEPVSTGPADSKEQGSQESDKKTGDE